TAWGRHDFPIHLHMLRHHRAVAVTVQGLLALKPLPGGGGSNMGPRVPSCAWALVNSCVGPWAAFLFGSAPPCVNHDADLRWVGGMIFCLSVCRERCPCED